MKIKKEKGAKVWFFISLLVLIGNIGMLIYELTSGEVAWFEILLYILMVIVMASTTIKFVEFKK